MCRTFIRFYDTLYYINVIRLKGVNIGIGTVVSTDTPLYIRSSKMKQHLLIKTENTEGTVDQTVYIGFYTSEVGSVDFIMFDIEPDYEE